MLRTLRAGSAALLVAAGGALAASMLVDVAISRDLLVAAAAALAAIFAALQAMAWAGDRRQRGRERDAVAVMRDDPSPVLLTDGAGTILHRNAAAERLGVGEGAPVARAFDAIAANPDALAHRLLVTVGTGVPAREEVMAPEGPARVAVHPVPAGLLWRVDALPLRPARVVGSVDLPILTAGPSGSILYMNDALRAATGRRVGRLEELFAHTPLHDGGLNALVGADGPVPVRVVLSAMGEDGRQDALILPAGDARDGRVALDDLPVALLRLDARGCVLFANRLARELLPATASTEETRFAAMVEGLGRSVGEWVTEAAAGRGLYRPEVVRVTGAEVEAYLQVTLGRPVDDADGGLLAVLNDATELKTLEAQFVQSQKMQAIGQLAGGVAHDFNNLLTAISGHCDLLLLRHREDDEDYADLTQITHNANRAAALVGQLLAFSRKQTLEMQPIDVRDALGDLGHLLNRLVGDRVTIRLDHDPALVPIRGDRRQLEQVLMNLVVNARDAMPEGGEIALSVSPLRLGQPLRRGRATVPPGEYALITVADEGVGIAPDWHDKIFEPFVTTKRPGEGTGLGLSTAYGIVKQTGGFIFVDSAPGAGARFSIYLPVNHDPIRPEGRPVTAGLVAGGLVEVGGLEAGAGQPIPGGVGAGKVLLVEDEAPVRAFAARALRMRGFVVIEADCAEAALELLEDRALGVDVIVTDVIMRGLDGPAWVRRALIDRPGTRVVFISGYTDEHFENAQAAIPNSVFLPKPFALGDLIRVVQGAAH